MTDEYPPFRLDMGGHEQGGTMAVPAPSTTSTPGPAVTSPSTSPSRRGWTGGRVVSLIVGCLLGLASFGLLAAGGVATWATNTQRDKAGYLTTDTRTFSTSSFAITSDRIDLGTATDLVTPGDILGTVRLRATATDPSKPVFIGVATQAAADRYLAGADHLVVTNWATGHGRSSIGGGTAPPTPPTTSSAWTAQAAGPGTQSLRWRPTGGHWVVVVMNPTGTAGVSVTADAAASVPDLAWIAAGLLAAGVVLLAFAVVLVAVPVARASR